MTDEPLTAAQARAKSARDRVLKGTPPTDRPRPRADFPASIPETANLDPGAPPAWRDGGHGTWYVLDPLRVADAMACTIADHPRNPSRDPRLRLGTVQIHHPTDGSPIQLMPIAVCDLGL